MLPPWRPPYAKVLRTDEGIPDQFSEPSTTSIRPATDRWELIERRVDADTSDGPRARGRWPMARGSTPDVAHLHSGEVDRGFGTDLGIAVSPPFPDLPQPGFHVGT